MKFRRISPADWLWILPAALFGLLGAVLPHFPALTEILFSRGLFRVVAVPLGFVTSLIPFSLTELLVVAAMPGAVFLIISLMRRFRRTDNRRALTRRVCRGVAWVLTVAFSLYMLMHGLNFYRQPVSALMGLDTSPKDAAFLQAVCADIATEASAVRAKLPVNEKGEITDSRSTATILRQAGEGYRTLAKEYPFLWGSVSTPKSVMLSHWWSYTGISGMYFPFFAEANVNTDAPLFTYPAAASHELAHTRGFAREDECNFLMFLSCRAQDDPLYQYAGHLLSYIYCENALYAYDPDMVWEVRETACSADFLEDLRRQSAYWDEFEGEVEEVSTEVNNAFLSTQGQEDGVLSYTRVVELILAYYDTVVWGGKQDST